MRPSRPRDGARTRQHCRSVTDVSAEVHLFAIWERGRVAEGAIVDDLAERFRVVDVVEVHWSPEQFARNLVVFYGDDLADGDEKVRECGTGPFLVVVVVDEHPRRRLRRRGWRLERINSSTVDAKARYRSMAGGGYRVHASDHAREADRDLVLLFGRRAASYAGARPSLARRQHRGDVLGAGDWTSAEELLVALEVTAGCRVVECDRDRVVIAVRDRWWAEQVLGGHDDVDGARAVRIGGADRQVVLVDDRRR